MDVLAAVQSFVSVARTLSFSAAAASEGEAQPVVSRRVAALESHLNGKLFDRSTRSVTLTPFGAAILPAARQVLAAEEALRDAVEAHRDGVLRLLIPPDQDDAAWAAVLLAGRANGYRIQVEHADRDRRSSRVLAGEVDLAITAAAAGQADWTIELGIAHHREDNGAPRLLRPARGSRDTAVRLLLLAEESAQLLIDPIRTAAVRIGLGSDQVQAATSTVAALAEVLAGDARLLCDRAQAQRWNLHWSAAPELHAVRRYRLESADPALRAALPPRLLVLAGRALGGQEAA